MKSANLKWLVVLFFFCITGGGLFAQVAVGIRSGMQVSYNNLLFEKGVLSIEARDNITGLVLAIPIEFPSDKMLAFQSGIVYHNKGTRIRYQQQGQTQLFITKYLIDYLSVPVLGKLSLSLGRLNLFLLGGGTLNYAVDMESLKLSYDHFGPPRYETLKMDFQNAQVSRFDLGLLLGGGIEAHIADGKKLFIDARFEFGMLDIDKRPENTVYNGGRSFTMGILLPLKALE